MAASKKAPEKPPAPVLPPVPSVPALESRVVALRRFVGTARDGSRVVCEIGQTADLCDEDALAFCAAGAAEPV